MGVGISNQGGAARRAYPGQLRPVGAYNDIVLDMAEGAKGYSALQALPWGGMLCFVWAS